MIRLATTADAAAIMRIYAPYCSDSVISFESEPPTVAEMARRIDSTLELLPWLVWDADGIGGYAYAGQHRDRAAYRWSVDVAVYIAATHHRRGIGRQLYKSLFDWLVRLGYYNAFAGVTLPNVASVGLHESLGFVKVAEYPQVGYKFGRWHNTGWWHKQLQPLSANPSEPVKLAGAE